MSARALAPLSQLVTYAEKFLENGAIGVFPKGQQADIELTGLRRDNRFLIESVPSRIDAESRLLIVRAARPAAPAPAET